MSMLICPKAYRKNGDPRGKIMCSVMDNICVHVRYCELLRKYRQTEAAEKCPRKEEKNADI